MQRKTFFVVLAGVVAVASVAQITPTQPRPAEAAAISVGWSSVGDGLPGRVFTSLQGDPTVPISSLNPLYVGGMFTNVGGDADADFIAKWDGSSWSKVTATALTSVGTPYVGAIAKSGTDLYVGGVFVAGSSRNIAKINSSGAVSGLTTGVTGGLYDYDVEEVAVDGSNVYVGGVFGAAGGVSNTDGFAKWDGTAWSALGTGLAATSPAVEAVNGLLAVGSDVYVGGQFTTAGGVPSTSRVAKWSGSAWSALGTGFTSGLVATFANIPSGTRAGLYAGGNFTTTGATTVNGIAKWNGTEWSALGSGVSGGGAVVEALAVDASGNLWAGGNFRSVGGVAANNIARWDGTSWSAISCGTNNGVNNTVRSISPQSDGSIVVAGFFTNAGGDARNSYIARYTPGAENCAMPVAELQAPQNVRSDFGDNGDVILTWDPPASSGNTQIVGYQAESYDSAVSCWTTGLSCVIRVDQVPEMLWGGMTLNSDEKRKAYLRTMVLSARDLAFFVRATNGQGWGAKGYAPPFNDFPAPDAPVSVSAIGELRKIEVTWSPPVKKQRWPITNYLATSSPGNRVCVTSGELKCVFRDLTPGIEYTFKVQALTAGGWGAASTSSNVAVAYNLRLVTMLGVKRKLLSSQVGLAAVAPGIKTSEVRVAWRINGGKWTYDKLGKNLTALPSGSLLWSRSFPRALRERTLEARFEGRGETSRIMSAKIR